MAAIIFLLILGSLIAMWSGRTKLATVLFFVSLLAVALLFNHHVTDALGLSL